MDDKEIKRTLKDAGLHLIDASKDWPKHRASAIRRFDLALHYLDELDGFIVNRPMGEDND